ncbi:MAG: TnpV protein [Clostridiales bacterium GWF2_38_85]|nr:MAG: TnpV protein [Clostridiales bacterium GWF2_38_85]HBL84165.1 TnpV protein [Clostridiales bacterium]
MEKHIIDEKTGIPYTLIGHYYYPFGDFPNDEPEEKPLGIWGRRHLRYICQHKRILYTSLLTSGKLNSYLADINRQAEEMLSRLVKQLAEKEGVTEQLKATNQMAWVGAMNNIRNAAAEIVNQDIIYK